MVEVGDRLPPIRLESVDGDQVLLESFYGRYLVVQLLRYYG